MDRHPRYPVLWLMILALAALVTVAHGQLIPSPITTLNGLPGLTIASGQLLLPDGTAAAPALSFSADTDVGLYRIGANNLGIVVGGATTWDFAANTLAQRNGTTAQAFNLYNTYTDASNYERLELQWGLAANIATILTGAAGTGSYDRELKIGSRDSSTVASYIRFVPASRVIAAYSFATVSTNSVSTSGTAASSFDLFGTTRTSTSGTNQILRLTQSFAPTATSTALSYGLHIVPTINYSAGTPGAGSYEALKIAVTETALPTGQNYLVRASAGAAGTTDIFTISNTGLVDILGSTGYVQMTEITAPAAGAANTARLYTEDNGAGKTRLVVLFPTGAAQVLATEP